MPRQLRFFGIDSPTGFTYVLPETVFIDAGETAEEPGGRDVGDCKVLRTIETLKRGGVHGRRGKEAY
ncbi:MAG: hypothetical protein CVU64_08635 [Deltaproteobacteria bacterium HGW-Deltaproteobacteria-21]|nr:MAG: hypothetical protein CVU64_08635 [Deltaproteobacteria bacterium HGW-Deltaproteobacteria-21]